MTREALLLLLAALHKTGRLQGDRIEHASVVPAEIIHTLAALGVRVVSQPGFLAARGDDYHRDLPLCEHPDLYRSASLLEAGAPVALSSDAPYGPVDPWPVMAAAVHRRTASGRVLGAAERLDPEAALRAYLAEPGDPGGRHRPIAGGRGRRSGAPLAEALRLLDTAAVRATVLNGSLLEG